MMDPFWAEVRRLLPDVDIVLLPPERPPPPAARESRLVGTVRARWVVGTAHDTLRTAWDRLLPGLPRPATVRRAWQVSRPPAAEPTAVLRLSLTAGHDLTAAGDAAAVLADARVLVEAGGGAVDDQRWTASGGLRLVTTLSAHVLELTGTGHAVTVALLSPPLPAPADLATEMGATPPEHAPL
jgi:hypothetical protein